MERRNKTKKNIHPQPPEEGFSDMMVDVASGEVHVAKTGVLRANALGSCVAVVLYDHAAGVGGLAHVMLPGRAPHNHAFANTRYAENALRALVRAMISAGARTDRLVACIAGGGNVLERENDTLCEANVASVESMLALLDIVAQAKDVGGAERRSLTLELSDGCIWVTTGNGPWQLLWPVNNPDHRQDNSRADHTLDIGQDDHSLGIGQDDHSLGIRRADHTLDIGQDADTVGDPPQNHRTKKHCTQENER
jgi:chemotaxis protein CheD